MSLHRHLVFAVATAAGLTQLGCGYANEGLSPPDIGSGPVAPLQFEVANPTPSDLFVDWTDTHAHFVMTRGSQELIVDQGCLPTCGDACACLACAPTAAVRRVPAGQSVSFEWPAVHFVSHSCDAGKGCECLESWPLTAGSYDVSFAVFKSDLGGVPSADDPDILTGMSPESMVPDCEALAKFSLAPSAAVHADLSCEP